MSRFVKDTWQSVRSGIPKNKESLLIVPSFSYLMELVAAAESEPDCIKVIRGGKFSAAIAFLDFKIKVIVQRMGYMQTADYVREMTMGRRDVSVYLLDPVGICTEERKLMREQCLVRSCTFHVLEL